MNNILQTIYQENISLPWEIMTDLDYDTQDNPASVTGLGRSTTLNGNPKALASSISYLPYGGITGLTYGNSLSLSQGYDNQYRTSSIAVGSLLARTYGYDANGNVTSFDDGEAAGNEALETAGIYTYDQGANLLADIWGQYPIVYEYDYNANTVSANYRTFVYDSSNQLIQVLDNSNLTAEYTYNGAGQRIKKGTSSGTRIFHYDLKGHLIAETTQSGTMLVEYVYLGDQLLAMIKPGENVYYFHNDHLGTPQVLTNESQTIDWKAAYTPFGEANITVGTVENNLRFPGQYYDAETGLHYNYFRYYDPTTGRYVTPDPIGLEGGINLWPYVDSVGKPFATNLYTYTNNNPIRFIDPFGLYWEYSQSTGQLTYVNNESGARTYVDTGYSGHGAGLNNPAMQNQPFVGPIPQGTWTIGPQEDIVTNTRVGLPASMRLTPNPGTNTFNRGGFIIHPDNPARNRTASQGCPVFDRPTRNRISGSGDTEWRVVP